MALIIRQVSGPKDLRRFILLAEKLHGRHPNWFHPLYLDEWLQFSPACNPAFAYCDAVFLLAEQDGRTVGRIAGIVNHRHNRYKGEKTARFAWLEAHHDATTVAALLEAVERWAARRAMRRVIGPYGFSDQDPEGFLIQGFEQAPTIGTYANFQWLPQVVERQGYAKQVDYVTYRIDVPAVMPARYHAMQARLLQRGHLKLVSVRNRRQARTWAGPAFDLMNEAYAQAGIYGFTPMDEPEKKRLLRRYLPLLDHRFLKGVTRGRHLAGFVIGIPDFTDGLRKARGRLLPFGFVHLLRSMRTARRLVLLLGAIRQADRGLGVDLLLMMEMWRAALNAGMREVDTHHQLETNTKIRAVSEWLGGSVTKRYRVFGKDIAR